MDERDWQAGNNLRRVLDCLAPPAPSHWIGRVAHRLNPRRWLDSDYGPALDWETSRKLRLWARACCSRVWDRLSRDGRMAVVMSERFADGAASQGELRRAAAAASAVAAASTDPEWRGIISYVTWQTDTEVMGLFLDSCVKSGDALTPSAWAAVWAASCVKWAAWATRAARAAASEPEGRPAASHEEERHTCLLLRDIFGNPFNPVALFPVWRTPTVLALAEAAYENRNLPAATLEPDRLAVLADALEDTGCDNPEILGHLRGDGPHVRGCWCVDALLAKE
jgi:hypothetical protein